MAEVLELRQRPASGVTAGDFLAANSDINAHLRGQPGSRWRRIVEADDSEIIDIVAYESAGHACAGASGIIGEMADDPMHQTIDHRTVDWQIATVLQHLEGDLTGSAGSACREPGESTTVTDDSQSADLGLVHDPQTPDRFGLANSFASLGRARASPRVFFANRYI